MEVFEALIVQAVSCIIKATTTFANYSQNFVVFVWKVLGSDGKGEV